MAHKSSSHQTEHAPARGRFSAGPFSLDSAEQIKEAMTRHDIHVSLTGGTVTFARSPEGLMLVASGADVHAYFTDAMGVEFGETDLEDFIMEVAPVNQKFTMQGSHDLDGQKVVISHMTAIHDGLGVTLAGHRSLHAKDASPVKLMTIEAPMDHFFTAPLARSAQTAHNR